MTYFLWCFTDIIGEPEPRYELGFVFISIALCNVAVHLISMIIDTIINIRLKCKRHKSLKDAKKKLQEKINNKSGENKKSRKRLTPKSRRQLPTTALETATLTLS